MIFFSSIFVITNLIFSFAVYLMFILLDRGNIKSMYELYLYAMGIGPAATALMLYYSFLIMPNRSNLEYLLLVILFYSIPLLFSFLIYKKKSENRKFKLAIGKRNTVFMIIFALFTTGVIIADPTKVLEHPMIGHDSLVYGVVGKMLYSEKSLEPIWVDDFSEKGFVYKVRKKPPSFSLLLTWEKIAGSFFKIENDLYYKSISVYYSILLIFIIYTLLSKKSIFLAILGVFALIIAPDFFLTLLRPHLDSFRIFFHSISLIFLFYSIKKANFFNIFLLGIYSGLAAFAHTIGLIAAVLNLLIFLILINGNFKYRISKTIFLLSTILLFGASHQIFNLVWGKNWIF